MSFFGDLGGTASAGFCSGAPCATVGYDAGYSAGLEGGAFYFSAGLGLDSSSTMSALTVRLRSVLSRRTLGSKLRDLATPFSLNSS